MPRTTLRSLTRSRHRSVWGVGLGITDVPAAVKFYTEVMAMAVEKENVQREDRVETVLASTKAGRGSRLVLMKYNDGRETRKITSEARVAGAVA